MSQILDGRALARDLRVQIKREVKAMVAAGGPRPKLAVILAGEDPASAVYVRNKEKMAARVGIDAVTLRLPADVPAAALMAEIDRLNADPSVHGILLQLPLPQGISAEEEIALLERVDPRKDVDGFHPDNLGLLMAGRPRFVACTPQGCMRLLEAGGVPLAGRQAVVIGRSLIVGKPIAQLLLAADATVTICHSRTQALAEIVRQADIVIAAVGRPGLVGGDWIKPGAAVIDVGVNSVEGALVGDVDFEAAASRAGWITPVPGGVGPMTIACLLENTRQAALRARPAP
ncbi:bifunctional methylenetetrahydrofolate dehydrogenase/methenyltetrahydrofolate cyclohydrolase FolD [Myxococcota bacterium]|nr:bifunctional methylenetetrahydrofolate dehydrogenase/methenyltetrahydrofolate cyclohydrolase FolD [Myxococcota bacterium]MBU1897184.1 bifunctional methylenetetrahydrofolate dehydrogenase/methenyltetrahydrofolate cyclohydrolase FolD [Myxococcota bacterium]